MNLKNWNSAQRTPYTVDQLSLLLGAKPAAVENMLVGRRKPGKKILEKIIALTGGEVNADDLKSWSEQRRGGAWISAETPPPDDKMVLTANTNIELGAPVCIAFYDMRDGTWRDGDFRPVHVTHWRYFPAMPK